MRAAQWGRLSGLFSISLVLVACESTIAFDGALTTIRATSPIDAKKANKFGGQAGINLHEISDWMPTTPFLNFMTRGRGWLSSPISDTSVWDDHREILTDSFDYVTELANDQKVKSVLMVSSLAETDFECPTGLYEFRYEGGGEFDFSGGAETILHDQASKTAVVQLNSCDFTMFEITSLEPDYLKNFELIPYTYLDEYNAGKRFHPDFLENWKDFKVLRFMDWAKTNNSENTDWAERTTTMHYSQASGKGVAIEYMIDLANELMIDPWFCIPHLVDKEYVEQMATLIKDQLNPGLTPYFEHSNEVWNTIFDQTDYAIHMGHNVFELSANEYHAGDAYHYIRSAQIEDIVDGVYGDGNRDRFKVIVGAHVENFGRSKIAFEYLESIGVTPTFDAIAIAPYFGHQYGWDENEAVVETYTPAQLVDLMYTDVDEMILDVEEYVDYYVQRGIDVIAYEGGQHLAGDYIVQNNETITELFHDTNAHPGMKSLYEYYLNAWSEVTENSLIALYSSTSTPSEHGSWGLLEHMTQGSSPKYDAVKEYIDRSPSQ